MKKVIKVKLAKLIDKTTTSTVGEGTRLIEFLERRNLNYDASIRVNGVVKARNYILRDGDVVMKIGEVNGGYYA